MANINYKSLSIEILENVSEIEDNTEKINIAIETYKNYVNKKYESDTASDAVNVRIMMVDIFRNIEGSNFDDSVEIMTKRIKKEFNSAKRKERYLRDLAKKEGKEYVSELVDFRNVDEDKEIITDKSDLIIDFDISKFLDEKVPERFGSSNEKISKPIQPTQNNIDKSKYVPLSEIFVSDGVVDVDKKINVEENEEIHYIPLNLTCENLDVFTFLNKYEKDKTLKYYFIDINVHTSKNTNEFNLNMLKPLHINQKNFLKIKKDYYDRKLQSLIDIYNYFWEFYLYVATNKNINDVIDEMKTIDVVKYANINTRIIKRLPNNCIISKF